MEQWRDIEGYEGIYQVSDMGNVRNVKYNRNLKPTGDTRGYLKVELCKDGKQASFKVHRLVALAFIPNPDNKREVDHINTIKTDNRVSNLRWFTRKQQITENKITKERVTKAGKCNIVKAIEKHKKKVLCITTGEIFDSAADAAKHYNLKNKSAVCAAANPNNDRKRAGKLPDGTRLEWKYIE